MLKGKIAVVTGGTMGLGKTIVQEFVKEGAQVITCSRTPVLDKDRIEGVIYRQCDIALPFQVREFAFEVLDMKGRVDILVNNAGIYERGYLITTDPNIFRYTLDVNVGGVFSMCHHFLPAMIASGYGRIINVSSGIVLTNKAGRAAYAASKAAVNALTKTLANELTGQDIKVNSMCPGRIRTRMDIDNVAILGPEVAIPTVMWLATLPKDGPSGKFWRNLEELKDSSC